MKRKRLAKIFMMISNEKKTFGLLGYIKLFRRCKGHIGYEVALISYPSSPRLKYPLLRDWITQTCLASSN